MATGISLVPISFCTSSVYAFQNTAIFSCKGATRKEEKEAKKQLGIQDAAEEDEGATYEPGMFGPDGELLQLPIAIEDMEPPAKRQRQCRTYNMPSTNERTPEG